MARVLADTQELEREQVTEPDSPTKFGIVTRFGDSATFHRWSVADLSRRMAPGTVDLIAAFPPQTPGSLLSQTSQLWQPVRSPGKG